jgi:hypothetical protein
MRKSSGISDAINPTSLKPLLAIDDIQKRLDVIFPNIFPNRRLLVGTMSARVIFVFLYGGFVGKNGYYLRPSHVYLFTPLQALKRSEKERMDWIQSSKKPGFRPKGKRWYADNSRESIRDDLMRYQYVPLGIIKKARTGNHSQTSSTPINYLDSEFASLFDPTLTPNQFASKAQLWRGANLNKATLQKMALKAANVELQDSDVLVEMPDKTRIRLSSGISNLIAKSLIEEFAARHLLNPIVLWISASDKKSYPHFVELASKVGLKFDLNSDLPDIILADIIDPVSFILCEIVATDGAVTEVRKGALLDLIRASSIPEKNVRFLTVFESREAAPFRKTFSQLALNSMIWFQNEPDLIVTLKASDCRVFNTEV